MGIIPKLQTCLQEGRHSIIHNLDITCFTAKFAMQKEKFPKEMSKSRHLPALNPAAQFAR